MATPKIFIKDRIYVPSASFPDLQEAKDAYTRHMYKEAECNQCEYRDERLCAVCETCPNYLGVIKLYHPKTIKGIPHLGLPVGDKRSLERKTGIFFEDYKVVDLRVSAPLQYKIKFTIDLREHQKKLAADFLRHKYGLLEAPPRTGKTVMMLYLGLKLGQRMLLLAHQHEYLQQFLWHIEGNEEEGIPKCTNLPEIQAKVGKKLYGFPKTDQDFKTMQFMVMTYQQFISEVNGKRRFDLVAGEIGTVAVDEVHKGGATSFATVLNRFPSRYRFGVTGTVKRKDGRHAITKMIMGPVVARTTVEAVVPTVFIKDTGIRLKRDPKLWVYKMKALCNSKPRNKMIIERCIKDVKAGHSVVIPLTFVKHIRDTVEAINDAYGEPIAEAFVGGGSEKHKNLRREILARAKSGETKVIVGTRSLLQLGLNVPRWSAIYTVIPISNEPNYRQETARVRTPMEGKRRPIVRLFYDSAMAASVACARNCVVHMKGFKYNFSKDAKTQACMEFLYSFNKRRGRDSDEDDFKPVRMIQEDDDDQSGQTSLGRARAGRR